MPRTEPRRRTPRVISVTATALLGAVLLTACGTEQRDDTAPPRDAEVAAGTPSAPDGTSTPSSGNSPYVDPGPGDRAPHNEENNAYRRPGEMSATSEKAADVQAKRVQAVLKRLWTKGTWDPDSVRATLRRELGAETGAKGKKLTVQGMNAHSEGDGSVTPEGAMVGLRVRDDACVTAYIQESSYGAQSNGPFMETGCIEPPTGH
ncbi:MULTISPECIES: hypothetical protein [Streptomyces]|uniref:Lipoprotein n=1 Tax=Streptomyces lasiicapitis TaxID=1923961 RepID=A0ABQ2M692_9ACTN|nr:MULTISPECIES: hypothetical protein [Streptomyces]QIB45186.1 hypothetical protein G3H79_21030 [Streptomyces aureoverticillatus]GGO47371.1 hypothetical protein GCM10012286_40510 [Streptomyces lasiicapitis]